MTQALLNNLRSEILTQKDEKHCSTGHGDFILCLPTGFVCILFFLYLGRIISVYFWKLASFSLLYFWYLIAYFLLILWFQFVFFSPFLIYLLSVMRLLQTIQGSSMLIHRIKGQRILCNPGCIC